MQLRALASRPAAKSHSAWLLPGSV